ncbi:PhzF family phenazine biosynthesis protein [Anaeroselena agilis]|uniref:PhzF family phenazine biosynthesis protein n=1 Tax=Anaeroselena agilis TaxID=3063788 RepID=A0ABU3P4M6_9FIRM|nr:PhzF family phenazine biosynthesis protein [Selenomonadales bacterium 4137-cl]
MRIPIYQVDAFTAEPYKGNPAAVCLLDKAADEAWMQSVAAEMNLSETAFIFPEGDGYRLRWFTPKSEVKLCGHATLATAHVLFTEKGVPRDKPINFHTLSGLLTARYADGLIELDFPASPVAPCEAPPGLVEALGVRPVFVGRGDEDYLVEVATEQEVRAAAPDFARLVKTPCRGVILTAPSRTGDYDFVSRFFAPAVGVNEDPVTGSAHCRLVPYWQSKLTKEAFTAYQASARGGFLKVAARGDRVSIRGHAVTVLAGELLA